MSVLIASVDRRTCYGDWSSRVCKHNVPSWQGTVAPFIFILLLYIVLYIIDSLPFVSNLACVTLVLFLSIRVVLAVFCCLSYCCSVLYFHYFVTAILRHIAFPNLHIPAEDTSVLLFNL